MTVEFYAADCVNWAPGLMLGSVGCYLLTQLCPTLLQPLGLQPTKLLCPWDFPSKNTGMDWGFPSMAGSTNKLDLQTCSYDRTHSDEGS